MKYGYARVSTLDQKLENQIEQLKNAGAETIVQEKLTGTTKQRPEFQDLLTLDQCQIFRHKMSYIFLK